VASLVLQEVSTMPCASSNNGYARPSETTAQPMQPERATRRTITLDIPQTLVDWLDHRAQALTISRSALVRQLVALAKEQDEN